MDTLESRTLRLNAMTRSESIPASMLQASSVSELQTMRSNEAARKRLDHDLGAMSRHETRELEDLVADQRLARRDMARVRARKTTSVDVWMESFRRRTEREKEAERRRIKEKMGLVKQRASVLGLSSEEAWKMAAARTTAAAQHQHHQSAKSGNNDGVTHTASSSSTTSSSSSSSSLSPPSTVGTTERGNGACSQRTRKLDRRVLPGTNLTPDSSTVTTQRESGHVTSISRFPHISGK